MTCLPQHFAFLLKNSVLTSGSLVGVMNKYNFHRIPQVLFSRGCRVRHWPLPTMQSCTISTVRHCQGMLFIRLSLVKYNPKCRTQMGD